MAQDALGCIGVTSAEGNTGVSRLHWILWLALEPQGSLDDTECFRVHWGYGFIEVHWGH